MKDTGALISLGANLQRLRTEKGLKLEELARSSEVSIGVLSQIERGLGNPSFRTLFKIAQGLGAPIGYFFSGIDRSGKVVRKRERKRLVLPINESGSSNGELVYELLSPDLTGSLELLWIEYGSGVTTEDIPFTHQGEECGVILQGRLEVHIAEDTFTLEAGDSIYLNSTVPHWFFNPGPETTVMVWAITPPSF